MILSGDGPGLPVSAAGGLRDEFVKMLEYEDAQKAPRKASSLSPEMR